MEAPPTISDIKEKWPHLLLSKFAKEHFSKLVNNSDVDAQNLAKKVDQIVAFSKKNKRAGLNQICDGEQNKEYAVLNILTTYFNEDISCLYKKYPMGTLIDDIVPTHNAPWIAVVEIAPETTLFYIFIENKMCTTTKTLFKAVELVLIFYFNFNMSYPKEISSTMQIIQNLLGIANTFGRSKKKTLGNKSRVYSLLTAINEP